MAAQPNSERDLESEPHLVACGFVEAPGEIYAAMAWAKRKALDLRYDRETLTASVKLTGPAAVGEDPEEPYLLTGSFAEYRLLPPIWKFVHPVSGLDVGLAAYPKPVEGSVLHPQGLICAPWSRMAYAEHGGPHSDWGGQTSWQQPVSGTVALTIPDMLDRLVREVGWSRGRMAALAP